MASADSVSRLRTLSGRVVVVRGAPALWKHGRVCRAHLLLFLAFPDSGERRLAYRTGDRCGLGSVWDHLHRHRGRAYAVRSARSRAVELAAHRAAGSFAGHRRGIAVLADRAGSDGAGLSALCGSGAAAGGICHLDRGLRGGIRSAVRGVLLSCARLRGEHASRRVLGSDVARIHRAWSLQAGRDADWARVSRAGAGASGRAGDLRCVAAHALLRQHCAAAGRGAVSGSGDGASALSGRRIPARGDSVPVHLRVGSAG